MKKSERQILIITGLPFRKRGNQSLIRFVKMFLKRDISVTMFSAGTDSKGENALEDDSFENYSIKSLQISFTKFLNSLVAKDSGEDRSEQNYFDTIKSEDVVPPYGSYTFSNMLNKWTKFLLYIIDNIFLFLYLLLFHSGKIRKSSVIIGYEAAYTLSSKWLSKLFGKVYINKFQGTILVATGRDLGLALRYFPHNYFGINSADLCIMVQDGTDGVYYAKQRGCTNIFNEPHGVLEYSHKNDYKNIVDELHKENKFVIVNIASGSTWKRTDRIIRGMSNLDKEILKNIVLITTYHAQNKPDLVEYTKSLGLEDNVLFLEGKEPNECNYMIQKADISIMTNDFSNLGNPILESVYYKTPIISIDDGSLDGFVEDGESGFLIRLNGDFDKNMAKSIEKLYKSEDLRNKFRKNLNSNGAVRELNEQQDREFNVIEEYISKCEK